MKLEYSYSFTIEFDSPVSSHCFALIAKPHSYGQKVDNFKINLLDYKMAVDGFGNKIIFGSMDAPHKGFYFENSGIVSIYNDDAGSKLPLEIFLQSTKLAPFCEELSKYDEKLKIHHLNNFQKAEFVCSFIYNHFTYERGLTDSGSDIRDVISHEKGVCQDFAHLMLTIMRLEGIPSRYISGLLDGEGETHAWIECFIEGKWIGFDPTHDTQTIDKPYIKFGIGRDYTDCTPNKGVFAGGTGYQRLVVNSKVTRLE